MRKFVTITTYDKVEHVRQFDDVSTFEGSGSGAHEIDIAIDNVVSVEKCLGQESSPHFPAVRLNDFFTLTTAAGVEYTIDLASRDAIMAAKSAL